MYATYGLFYKVYSFTHVGILGPSISYLRVTTNPLVYNIKCSAYINIAGAVYGDGVHFFAKANSSTLKFTAPADESGRCYIYYCSVPIGSFTNGRAGLKCPPYKDIRDDGGSDIFDSVVDNV